MTILLYYNFFVVFEVRIQVFLVPLLDLVRHLLLMPRLSFFFSPHFPPRNMSLSPWFRGY